MKTAKFTKLMTVPIEPVAFQKIKEITDQERISIGEWCRRAIDAALANHNSKKEQKDE